MADLRNRYQAILKDLDSYFQNEEDKQFVTRKFHELSMMFMDVIDRLTYITDMKVKEVEEKQKEIESKIANVQKAVDGIENDIYEAEEGYEFEIACPYCNHEFVADINSEMNTEVECPECHNIIELDWNGEEEECVEECSHCSHDCKPSKNEPIVYEQDDLEKEIDQEDEDM